MRSVDDHQDAYFGLDERRQRALSRCYPDAGAGRAGRRRAHDPVRRPRRARTPARRAVRGRALHTGNDDHIVGDLLMRYPLPRRACRRRRRGARRPRDGPAGHAGHALFSFSTGKAMAATVAHLLVEDGVIGYETPLVDLWPEFGEHGKAAATSGTCSPTRSVCPRYRRS